MVERANIERFRSANSELSARVKAELEAYFGALDLSKPEAARNALLEFVPLLTEQYGAVAATLAADWYDELRLASGSTSAFRTVTAPAVPAAAVQSQVRFLAGHLWSPEPMAMLGGLLASTDKYVKQPGRDTVAFNAEREGVRWARVPTGGKTCSWCLIIASRDAVFLSERSATKRADGGRYHGACDCQAVRIADDDDYPEGYLPSEYYEMYTTARDEAGSGNMGEIATSMRRLFPNFVNDGVHSH